MACIDPHLDLVDIVDGVVELHWLTSLWLLRLGLVALGGGSPYLIGRGPAVGGLVIGVVGGAVSGRGRHVGGGRCRLRLHGEHVQLVSRHWLK